MLILNCKKCEKEFNTTLSRIKDGKGKFCSKICYTNHTNEQNIGNIINYHCIVCNKGMHLTPYLVRMNRKCCSIKCQHELQKKNVLRQCIKCEHKFVTHSYGNKKFCGVQCKNNHLKRELECMECHTTFIASIRFRKIGRNNYFCSNRCKFQWCKGKPHPKMSEWLAKNISNGTFHPRSKYYKQGYIINKSTGKKEFFASSYEQLRMEQLNKENIQWTKHHKLKIKYLDKNGIYRYYIPDFLIDNKILEEIKSKNLLTKDNNPEKFKAGFEYCKNNNLTYKIVTEKELGI